MDKKNRIQFFLFLICVVGYLILHNLDIEKTDKIFKDGEFAIGKIKEFYSSKPSVMTPGRQVNQQGQTSRTIFSFIVDSLDYTGRQSSDYYTPSDSVEIGEFYLVVYNKKEPEKCRILFDCPIRDSSDFKKYLGNKEMILKEKKHNQLIKPCAMK